MSIKVTSLITGARKAGMAFRLMNAETRKLVAGAVQVTTGNVTMRAVANAPVSGPDDRKAKGRPGPGELRDSIRSESSADGLVGSVLAGYGKLVRRRRAAKMVLPLKAKAYERWKAREEKRRALMAERSRAVYAMVINYGSPGRGIPATHFMDRAREAERQPHVNRVKAALQQAADAVGRAA